MNIKEIPIIRPTPPLFYENHYITDFKKKIELFNCFCSKQCSVILGNISVPADKSHNYWQTLHYTTVTFSAKDESFKILIQTKSIEYKYPPARNMWWFYLYTLDMIFKQAILTGVFPSEWEKENIVSIHKKSHKENIENHCPVSPFRFVGKYLKDLLLSKVLTFSPLKNSSLKTSPVSKPMIPVSTSCYQSPTKFLHFLIMTVWLLHIWLFRQ